MSSTVGMIRAIASHPGVRAAARCVALCALSAAQQGVVSEKSTRRTRSVNGCGSNG
ncbi:hypothetical protein GS885_03475 [Rhodococcus hoagii]|uniref:Uncharacterized protein n=1 Tax=Prescottella equi ATCC 33707 TaxID=525370 RepID=E9SXU4_RHOHA|nr:hypothetical protein HMPREF0724_11159 [Prescottella equi ATCC 33707]MBM4495633.1 hypothetical protein [Prescottella equi]MBM4582593.1 hypothetical protein [Prescottella equi]NKR46600.1 hypothetical protein [Prescottella equi]NKS64261.1 hypothetical protein [Prescottella equi]